MTCPPPAWTRAAADWLTIWQSELNALAADREPAEAWAAYAALWTHGLKAAAALLPKGPNDGPHGHAGTEPPARPAAAMVAPDDNAARRIELLARRVEDLERRLAELGSSGMGGTELGGK